MREHDPHLRPVERAHADDEESHEQGGVRRGLGHHWLMIACCIPMLAIAGAIALSGAGFGFFVIAVACTAMMGAMMGAMSGGDERRR